METSTVLSNSSTSRAYGGEAHEDQIHAPSMISASDGREAPLAARIAAVMRQGSAAEQIATFRGLSLYPDPDSVCSSRRVIAASGLALLGSSVTATRPASARLT
jgi:hypothetical protein